MEDRNATPEALNGLGVQESNVGNVMDQEEYEKKKAEAERLR